MDLKKVNDYGMISNMINYLDHYTPLDLYELLIDAIEIKSQSDVKIVKYGIDLQFVLDYCLNHKIPDNLNRNAILFKNLVIWMVNSRLDDNKIKSYGKEIIKNCPGKNIREWTGWVSWARKQKREINPWELNSLVEEFNVRRDAKSGTSGNIETQTEKEKGA
jgi:hypothetical protein